MYNTNGYKSKYYTISQVVIVSTRWRARQISRSVYITLHEYDCACMLSVNKYKSWLNFAAKTVKDAHQLATEHRYHVWIIIYQKKNIQNRPQNDTETWAYFFTFCFLASKIITISVLCLSIL